MSPGWDSSQVEGPGETPFPEKVALALVSSLNWAWCLLFLPILRSQQLAQPRDPVK